MSAEIDGPPLPNTWISTEDVWTRLAKLRAVAEAARELMESRSCHIEGSVPLLNALAALDAKEGE
jgi:hypothetical protein